jgi:hypothetical protein
MAGGRRLRLNIGLTRDVRAGSHLQTMLVAAVSTVLVTRTYLALTGYPRMGIGSLHIAHVLWGGLLMCLALSLSVGTLGTTPRRVAAAVGGIGFGLFIDELGKFVSRDVDYFFQPAVALIYMVFVALFLVYRAVDRRSQSPEMLLANASNELTECILEGAVRTEVARARDLLDRSAATGPLADGLRAAISGVVAAPDRPPVLLARVNARIRGLYARFVRWRGFRPLVVALFVIQGLGGVIVAVSVLADALPNGALVHRIANYAGAPRSLVGTISSMVSLVLVVIGTLRLPRSRLAAYRWYERSLLVAVFVTQVSMFWQSQLAATGVLAWNLLLLACLATMMRQETSARGRTGR